MDDLLYYLGFNRVTGIGPARLDRLLAFCGSLDAAWHADAATLGAAGLDARTIRSLQQTRRTLDLDAEYARALEQNVRLITRDDPAYPPLEVPFCCESGASGSPALRLERRRLTASGINQQGP